MPLFPNPPPTEAATVLLADDYGPLIYGGVAGAATNGATLRAALDAARTQPGLTIVDTAYHSPILLDWVDVTTIPGTVGMAAGQSKTCAAVGGNVQFGGNVWILADVYTAAKYGAQGTVRNAIVTNLDQTAGNAYVGWRRGFTIDGNADLQVGAGLGPTRNSVYTTGDFVCDGAYFVRPSRGSFVGGLLRNIRGVGSTTDATHAETFALMVNGSNSATHMRTLIAENEIAGVNAADVFTVGITSTGISHQSITGCLTIGNRVHTLGGNAFADNNAHNVDHVGNKSWSITGNGGNIENCTYVVHHSCAFRACSNNGGVINGANGTTTDSGFVDCTFDSNALGVNVTLGGGTLARTFVLSSRLVNNTGYGFTIGAGASAGFYTDIATLYGAVNNNPGQAQFHSGDFPVGQDLDLTPGTYVQNHTGTSRQPTLAASGATTANLAPIACWIEVTTGAGVTVSAATVNGVPVGSLDGKAAAFTMSASSKAIVPVPVGALGALFGLTYAGGTPTIKLIVPA